ncbi:adenylate cyclase class 2 [Providencia alcalifaciens]|nr:adenylate cyclase class 2 [Providencia alcalifaciens]
MNQHFVGKYEAEIKFKLPDHKVFLQQIMADGAETFAENNRETDYFFDHAGSQLNQQNISMSVREMSPSGIKLWIVKGPEASECKAIDIDDCDHVKNMLTTLGYKCNLTTSKTRSIYFLNDAHITIDHLVNIGWFAEFAIMTDDDSQFSVLTEQMMSLARQYGFSEELIEKRSYKQIHIAHANSVK